MEDYLSLNSPIKMLLVKIFKSSLCILGRTEKKDELFKDFLLLGCDFFELLEIYSKCDGFTECNIECIANNVENPETITGLSDKELRKVIPHWSASKHHTASIEEVCLDVKEKITQKKRGAFVYNSNLNSKSKKVYNDIYVLLISKQNTFFFDINRKKAYKILL